MLFKIFQMKSLIIYLLKNLINIILFKNKLNSNVNSKCS